MADRLEGFLGLESLVIPLSIFHKASGLQMFTVKVKKSRFWHGLHFPLQTPISDVTFKKSRKAGCTLISSFTKAWSIRFKRDFAKAESKESKGNEEQHSAHAQEAIQLLHLHTFCKLPVDLFPVVFSPFSLFHPFPKSACSWFLLIL